MRVDRAGSSRDERYDRWYPLLQKEIDLVATPGAGIVTVGKVVSNYLEQKPFGRSFTGVIHYSGQAGRARNEGIVGREDSFQAFRDTVSLDDLIATAVDVLRSTRVPDGIRDQTLLRLRRSQLTTSRKQLIFNYKIAFESMRS